MFVGQVSVYSVALYLFACHMGLVKVNFDIIIRTLLPISTRRYWFATIYVGMYLLFPVKAASWCPAVDVVNCPYIDGTSVQT